MKKIDVVIDSDTYNEVDDQFAIIYGLVSRDIINIKAILAAPFYNRNSSSPKDGMEKSYQEIKHIISMFSIKSEGFVYPGATRFMEDEKTYVDSLAARYLVELAMSSQEKITVVAIAALTNIASAIVMEPRIVEHIKVVWLGGHDYYQKKKNEFNLRQDISAARVVFNSGVELVHIPCLGVVTNLTLTLAELEKIIDGKNKIGTYLTEIFRKCNINNLSYSRTISDVAAMAYVINPNMMEVIEEPRPDFNYNLEYVFNKNNSYGKKVIYLDRNKIIDDLLQKIINYK